MMADRARRVTPAEFVTDNRARLVTGWSALAVGAVALAVGLPVLLQQGEQRRAGFGPTLLPGLLLGLGLAGLLLGGVRLWQALSRHGESFALREDGLVHRVGGASRRVPWADIRLVREARGRGPKWLGYGTHLRVRTGSGADLLVTGYTADARRLAEAIAAGVRGAGAGEVTTVRAWWWPVGSASLLAGVVLSAALWGHAQRVPEPGFDVASPRACAYFSARELTSLRLDEGVRLSDPIDERIVNACQFATQIVSSSGGAYAELVVVHVWSEPAVELAEEWGFTARPDGAEGYELQRVGSARVESCSVLYDISDTASVSVRTMLGGGGSGGCAELLPEAVPELLEKLP
ncbi:hypothetical protein RM844_18500 [Streptomyces sp. DSM 44915]|uniref:PH domain-containing protein n=1 Tax=Streptomyces chisholmiae TaxID=3075540 RepID=A0ABU2JTG6_9ACTN|nr:hypothetical protein [Streptomyces sp. DSM 44915]MDT0268277.1 hypothetical protein [Streptomyces sp. DSM 44915]